MPRRRAFVAGAAIIARGAPIARALDVAIVLHATDGGPDGVLLPSSMPRGMTFAALLEERVG